MGSFFYNWRLKNLWTCCFRNCHDAYRVSLSLSERCKLTKPCAQTVSKTSLCSILKFFYYCCFCWFCLCLFIENDGIKIPISGTRCKSNFILTLPITFESTQSLGVPRKGTGTGTSAALRTGTTGMTYLDSQAE